MQENKFDKILQNKIKKTFEEREVEYNPEHWAMLVSKKKGKKRGLPFYWKIAGVALVLVLSGSLINYFNTDSRSFQETEIKVVEENINSERDEVLKENDITNKAPNKDDIDEEIVNKDLQKDKKLNQSNKSHLENNQITVRKDNQKLIFTENESDLANTTNQNRDSVDAGANSAIKLVTVTTDEKDTTSDIKLNEANDLDKKDSDIRLSQIEDVSADTDVEVVEKSPKRNIKIGLNVSPLVNIVAENDNSNIGFSSGVTVELPVLNKFDIYTGVLYTNQKFGSNNNQLYASDALVAGGVYEVSSEATVNGIEIPLNIKYNFAVSNKLVFVSAGFSSTSYFSENTKTDYVMNSVIESNNQDLSGSDSAQFSIVQTNETVNTNVNPDDGFDFASMLNFSVGMEFPVKNQQQSIVIEPYFKYSLQTITVKELDFTSAGFYLRYNFSFKHKK